jgi:hypothetical protein
MGSGKAWRGKAGEGSRRWVDMGVRKVLYNWVREVKVLGGFLGISGFFWRIFSVLRVFANRAGTKGTYREGAKDAKKKMQGNPHPNPLPEYRARGKGDMLLARGHGECCIRGTNGEGLAGG